MCCVDQEPAGECGEGGGNPESPTEECPDVINISIVDDAGDASTNAATTLARVQVSNRRADRDLPTGYTDNSPDRDNFKIEITDTTVEGDTIAADKVEIEMLKPGAPPTSFSPARKLSVELKRVGATGNLFRSKYLRLVVDGVDLAVNPAQMLLADWDSTDDTIEILGQVMRVKYTSASDEHTAQATVGSANRTSIRVAVHILNASVGGAGVVTTANGRQRILKWFRRVYAQISMTPKLLQTRTIDPVENLVAISNNTGANATGGAGNQIGFRLKGVQTGVADDTQTIGPLTLNAGDSPMATAGRLAALVSAPFAVRTVQNPPTLEAAITQGSADLIFTHTGGRRVVIDNVVGTDATQTVVVGRANPASLQSWAQGGVLNWVVGSEQQRAVLQAYDTGSDRIDLFVANQLSSGNRGEAMMPGTIYAAGKQAIAQVTMSAFCAARTMDGTDNNPRSCPHEAGHVLMDVIHATGDTTQLMRSGTSGTNAVAGSKRFSETGVTFDNPSSSIVQETRIRANGTPVLEPLT